MDNHSQSTFMAVLRLIKLIKVESNTNLIEQGEQGDRFFVVLKGTCAVQIVNTIYCPKSERRTLGETIENYLKTLTDNFHRAHWSRVPYGKHVKQLILQSPNFQTI